MKVGIIAAGKGERLTRGGITTPKPLLPVAGRPLIARIIDASAKLKAESVACIVNDLNPTVAGYLRSTPWPLPVELVVKTTPSSMESLFSLAPLLKDEPFLLFTVDVVFALKSLENFIQHASRLPSAKGVFALTHFIDDEKPLWVVTDDRKRITVIGERAAGSQYVTAGFYYITPDVFSLIDMARQLRFGALRQFLGLLVDEGHPIYGLPAGKTVDVDSPEDIATAEAFVREMDEI